LYAQMNDSTVSSFGQERGQKYGAGMPFGKSSPGGHQ
jgi:hypothetical protein